MYKNKQFLCLNLILKNNVYLNKKKYDRICLVYGYKKPQP
jgi:hypothetical protein